MHESDTIPVCLVGCFFETNMYYYTRTRLLGMWMITLKLYILQEISRRNSMATRNTIVNSNKLQL